MAGQSYEVRRAGFVPALLLGFALGVAGDFLVDWRRPPAALWLEIAIVVVLALGWLGAALALRRWLDASLSSWMDRIKREIARLESRIEPSPGALPGAERGPGPSNRISRAFGARPASGEGDEPSMPPATTPPPRLSTSATPTEDLELSPAPAPAAAPWPAVAPWSEDAEGPPGMWSSGRAPGVEELVGAWQAYFERGDERFTPYGLQRMLEEHGLAARVVPVDSSAFGPDVVAVEDLKTGTTFLLPSFNATIRALEEWFQPAEPRSLTARIRRLLEPARLRRSEGRWVLDRRGGIE